MAASSAQKAASDCAKNNKNNQMAQKNNKRNNKPRSHINHKITKNNNIPKKRRQTPQQQPQISKKHQNVNAEETPSQTVLELSVTLFCLVSFEIPNKMSTKEELVMMLKDRDESIKTLTN
ncbi:hypothetical protein Bhyg_07601 [Pseudolycoriella hygida]|uniref:Uncharacterized protein n=1 Tax=Pseudolycoriella hygida TaxID=35572 RepID=A0A9Q0N2Z4_9DIPT|nr:hypothetical protein Bhyg_07601 [Pseudolycoriella hygida]